MKERVRYTILDLLLRCVKEKEGRERKKKFIQHFLMCGYCGERWEEGKLIQSENEWDVKDNKEKGNLACQSMHEYFWEK